MVLCDECRVAESPIVEVADDGNAARVGGDEDELNRDRLADGNGVRMAPQHADRDDGYHASSERGGPSGPPRDAGRGAQPTDDAAPPAFGVEAPHANHDPTVKGLVEANRMLELL